MKSSSIYPGQKLISSMYFCGGEKGADEEKGAGAIIVERESEREISTTTDDFAQII